MLNVTIDGIRAQVKEGSTILEAAQSIGVEIPTLCYLKDLTPGFCFLCFLATCVSAFVLSERSDPGGILPDLSDRN